MRTTLTAVALMLMFCVSALAQINAVPQLMNFQGRLAKPDGTPVPDGNYSVRFSLWTAQTGGTEKWNQTVNPVIVKNGTFAVQLNTSTGAGDKFNNNLFLEIKIGTNGPLTPRQPLASVAYAMKADSVKDGSITANSLANNAVTSAKIADNAISTNKLANGSITSAKLDSNLQGMLGGFTTDTDHMVLVGNADLGGRASAVAVAGNYAYVLGFESNNTLKIYDVTFPTAPTLKGTVATAADPKALAVSGNHAYVLSGVTGGTLEVFDVSNPTNPTFKGSVATVNAPTALAVSGSRAYVTGGTNQLQVFNVSNPAAPVLRGTATTTGTLPNCVAVSGNFAFVTTRAGGPEKLQSIDVTNPDTPIALSFVQTGAVPISVAVSGNYAYVAHHTSSGPVRIFDISNPAAPTFVNDITTGNRPTSVAVSGPFAYVVCSSGFAQSFHVANPLVPLYIEGITTGRGHTSVAANSNYVYAVDRGTLNANGSTNNDGTLQVFARRTQGISNNFFVQGGGFFYGGLDIDQGALNNGGLASGLTFGPASGEGIASKRTAGGNVWGLDFYTAYQNRMTITNNGLVGIGTTTPAADLDVDGSVAAKLFFTTSDARYKQNVATLENPLETILNLRGVTYDWKQKDFPDRNFAAGKQIGFIAQEVEKVLPELVSTDSKGYKSVAYQNVVPVLVEAVKTLNQKNEALQTELAELKALVQRLAEQQKADQK